MSRKVFSCLALLFLFSTSVVSSQETLFGIKAGANYSSIVGDLTEGLKFRFSGHAGVFIEFDLSYKFKFQPELLYSSQGFQFSSDLASIEGGGTGNQNDVRNNVQLNFLTIPLVGKFALNKDITIEFGPQFGFLLNQVIIINNLDVQEDMDVDRRTATSGDFQLDYGAAVGLGIRITDELNLAPRAYIGLRNRLNGLPNAQNYNIALQLSLNYTFL